VDTLQLCSSDFEGLMSTVELLGLSERRKLKEGSTAPKWHRNAVRVPHLNTTYIKIPDSELRARVTSPEERPTYSSLVLALQPG
jgi:hypothetical protein